MKISTKTRYGMRFMIDLAQSQGEGRVALKDIADRVIYIKNGVAERVEQNDSPKKPEEIEW